MPIIKIWRAGDVFLFKSLLILLILSLFQSLIIDHKLSSRNYLTQRYLYFHFYTRFELYMQYLTNHWAPNQAYLDICNYTLKCMASTDNLMVKSNEPKAALVDYYQIINALDICIKKNYNSYFDLFCTVES